MNKLILKILIILSIYSYNVYPQVKVADFGSQDEFFFGLANAPGHVEDELYDAWLEFAYKGGVAAYWNTPYPEYRLGFWSEPEVELDIAASTGVKVFRLGVDWSRLSPFGPGTNLCGSAAPCPRGVQDFEALERYKEIIKMARSRGMRVMLTLFHHSLPHWSMDDGGWANKRTIEDFMFFVKDVVEELSPYVDYWITFNEPSVFAFLTYASGLWPPGGKVEPTAILDLIFFKGKFVKAVENMAEAHLLAYDVIHDNDRAIADLYASNFMPAHVGIAQNIAKYSPSRGALDSLNASYMDTNNNFKIVDMMISKMDFLGLNFYGEEVVKGLSVELSDKLEYSESGRGINPTALYELLLRFNDRYNVKFVNRKNKTVIPFMITENGVSDSTDIIRKPYLIEHLIAVHKAREAGVPINGYVFWTATDNWEWADGYCPKFGLMAVDRLNGMKRIPRPSYYLFKEIVKNGAITSSQRENAWNLLRANVNNLRPMCRSLDGKTALDEAEYRKIRDVDWRFKLTD